MFRRQKAELDDNEDMFFDAQNYSTSNKQVANILSKDNNSSATAAGEGSQATSDQPSKSAVVEATLEDLDGAQWGDDELAIDLDVNEDLGAAVEAPEEGKTGDTRNDSNIFVPPASGPNPII